MSPDMQLTCQDCGSQNETVVDTVCPYQADVHNEEVPATLCDDCHYERAMDI